MWRPYPANPSGKGRQGPPQWGRWEEPVCSSWGCGDHPPLWSTCFGSSVLPLIGSCIDWVLGSVRDQVDSQERNRWYHVSSQSLSGCYMAQSPSWDGLPYDLNHRQRGRVMQHSDRWQQPRWAHAAHVWVSCDLFANSLHVQLGILITTWKNQWRKLVRLLSLGNLGCTKLNFSMVRLGCARGQRGVQNHVPQFDLRILWPSSGSDISVQ